MPDTANPTLDRIIAEFGKDRIESITIVAQEGEVSITTTVSLYPVGYLDVIGEDDHNPSRPQ